jgi:Tripartite tricarboxylate transporter family receptor/Fumarylacetoacetate (FAA) hydrolase family
VFFRPLAAQLTAATEQHWVVENRPDAGGLLAVEAAMRAAPDGYTLLVASQNVPVTRRYLSRGKPIEPTSELTPISALWRTTLVISSHPSFRAKSLKELIADARSNPGKIAYTTSGIGTQAHTADMINGPRDLIRFLSSVTTLKSGTLITTGTSAGVSKLVDGDHLEGTIDGIGTMELEVRAEA